jgi:hypothetical protein
VALCLSTEKRVAAVGASFNYGNLPRGVNPLFMFSRVLPLMIGHAAGFSIYVEDVVLSSEQA